VPVRASWSRKKKKAVPYPSSLAQYKNRDSPLPILPTQEQVKSKFFPLLSFLSNLGAHPKRDLESSKC
jgi:hypothetical protein